MVFRLHKIEPDASVSSDFYRAGRYALFPSFAGSLVNMHRFPHSFKSGLALPDLGAVLALTR